MDILNTETIKIQANNSLKKYFSITLVNDTLYKVDFLTGENSIKLFLKDSNSNFDNKLSKFTFNIAEIMKEEKEYYLINVYFFEKILSFDNLDIYSETIVNQSKYIDYLIPLNRNKCMFTLVNEQKNNFKAYNVKNNKFLDVQRNVNDDKTSYLSTNFKETELKNNDFFQLVLYYGNVNFNNNKKILTQSIEKKLEVQNIDIAKYIESWDKYNKQEEIQSFKNIKSNIFKISNIVCTADHLEFTINEKKYNSFQKLADEQNIIILDEEPDIKSLSKEEMNIYEMFEFQHKVHEIKANTIRFRGNNKASVNTDKVLKINEGWATISYKSSAVMFNRREKVKQRIISNNAGFKNLNSWLTDTPEGNSIKSKVDIDHRLLDDIKLTELQLKAIELGLNTPDFLVVQGPPGCGKSTFIKYLIEQLNSKAEKMNKKSTTIFSGFRHETVLSGLDKINIYGLPTRKIGGKDGAEDDFLHKVVEYKNTMLNRLENEYSSILNLTKPLDYIRKKIVFFTIHIISVEDTLNLLKEIKKITYLHDTLKEKVDSYIQKLNVKTSDSRELLIDFLYSVPLKNAKEDSKELFEAKFDNLKTLELISSNEIDVINSILSSDIEDEEIIKRRNKILSPLLYKSNELITDDLKFEIVDFLKKEIEPALFYIESSKLNKQEYVISNYVNSIEENPLVTQETILKYSKIIGSTNQQVASSKMSEVKDDSSEFFTNVIIDEAATSPPLDLLIPMAYAEELIVLVGDQNQLPNIVSDDIADEIDLSDELKTELKETLFKKFIETAKRLQEKDGIQRFITLDSQFRMHPTLGQFVGDNFYIKEGGLKSPRPASDFAHNYGDLSGKFAHFINVKHDDNKIYELHPGRKNESEAIEIINHIKRSIKTSFKVSIGIIAPFRAQKDILNDMLLSNDILFKDENGRLIIHPIYQDKISKLECGTVDAFQGKEFDVVYFSTTISYPKNKKLNEKNFSRLTNEQMLCVAFSRQKNLLILVGNKDIFVDNLSQTTKYAPSIINFIKLTEGN